MCTLRCGFGYCKRWTLTGVKTMTQEHASHVVTTSRSRKTKASRSPGWPWSAEWGFGKERRGWGDWIVWTAAVNQQLFPCPPIAVQQSPPCQGKQSNPNRPHCSRISPQDRTSPWARGKEKRCYQMRYGAYVIEGFLTGTAKKIGTSNKGGKIEREIQK